ADVRARLVVVLRAGGTPGIVVPTAGFELVDHLVEVSAGVVPQLLAHLAHPACHALRVRLVEAGGVVAQVVHPIVVGSHHGKAGHEAGQLPAPAVLADRCDFLGNPEGEHRDLPPAARTAVLVDGHGGGL